MMWLRDATKFDGKHVVQKGDVDRIVKGEVPYVKISDVNVATALGMGE